MDFVACLDRRKAVRAVHTYLYQTCLILISGCSLQGFQTNIQILFGSALLSRLQSSLGTMALWFPYHYSQRFLMFSHIFLVSTESLSKDRHGRISEELLGYRAWKDFKSRRGQIMVYYAIITVELSKNLVHPHLNINRTSHIIQATQMRFLRDCLLCLWAPNKKEGLVV